MNLPQNLFDGSINAQVILCQADKTRIGEIITNGLGGNFKFNTYSEISFSIDRFYNDLFDGITKVNPYYDLVDSIRVIEIRGVGHFVIQDIDEEVADNESKSITCYSLEYSTGQKYLENFYVNTGEEGSIETMYHSQQYGVGYSIDDYYTLADKNPDSFDAYERYYIKDYENGNGVSYNYVERQVLNKEDYKKKYDEFELYIKKYPNVRFYWPTKPELSLLHHVFDRIPEWKIGHVDKELWYQERTFSEDRTAVYDFLYNKAAETLKFVMVWESISGTCSFYKTEEDGIITNNYVRTATYNPNFVYYSDDKGTRAELQPTTEEDVRDGVFYINVGQSIETQWDTDVFISRENLASQIDVKYSTDDIKTKLKITGADSLDVRDVNLGQNYIMNLSFYNTPLWMGADLSEKYTQYTKLLDEKIVEYKKMMSEWSATYNEYNDLMNYVPVEPRVLLVGDLFEKLYCTYTIVKAIEYVEDGVYYNNIGQKIDDNIVKSNLNEDGKTFKDSVNYYINKAEDILPALKEKLGLYRVGVDDNGTISKIDKADDVLLTLENNNGDSITSRVRCTKAPTIDKSNDDKVTYYTNSDYIVCFTKTTASSGLSVTFEYTLTQWINGELIANGELLKELKLFHTIPETGDDVFDFTVKSIGTLGAYLCLARDETKKENVEDYGIRLLQEKQDVYTKIFITQTEGYMSQEGSRCVAQANEPEGASVGDKWLKTNSKNASVYIYVGKDGKFFDGRWNEYSTGNNSADFENYTRFIDNYEKLQVVQEVLKDKQYEASLLLDGISYPEFYITGNNVNQTNLLRAAITHLIVLNNPYVRSVAQPSSEYELDGMIWFQTIDGEETIYHWNGSKWEPYKDAEISEMTAMDAVLQSTDEKTGFTYITFIPTTHSDMEYAVYLSNGIPNVCYSRAQGLTLAKMNVIKEQTDMNTYFNEQELVRLSPFIREDEYSDNNFLLTGYESEEEQMKIKQELLDAGIEELNKISRPKLSFDMTMANILAIPEFAPLKKQFKLGNFVRVFIRPGYPEKARLLEVNINFEDDSDFSCTFGNLISTKSEVDKHADLLQQAVTAGKSVAANKSSWQKGADKATKLDNAINDGLRDAALSIGAADGQAIIWDKYGIRGRKLIDGTTDQYHDEQFALINNKLAFTTDNWKTSRAVVGEFDVEIKGRKQNMYGLLADAIVGGYIQGTEIVGGRLEIGGNEEGDKKFIVKEDGSVEIGTVVKTDSGNTIKSAYASADALAQIDQLYKYRVILTYDGPAVFASADNTNKTTITATVYDRDSSGSEDDITSTIDASKFTWIRSSPNAQADKEWAEEMINGVYTHKGVKQIIITHADVIENSHFSCKVEI